MKRLLRYSCTLPSDFTDERIDWPTFRSRCCCCCFFSNYCNVSQYTGGERGEPPSPNYDLMYCITYLFIVQVHTVYLWISISQLCLPRSRRRTKTANPRIFLLLLVCCDLFPFLLTYFSWLSIRYSLPLFSSSSISSYSSAVNPILLPVTPDTVH